MPRIYTTRNFCNSNFYYIYNYSPSRYQLFRDRQDYVRFETFLKDRLLSPPGRNPSRAKARFAGLELHAYALWPYCFQLIIRTDNARLIPAFMRSLSTSYAMYFNHRYSLRGSPFSPKYRSASLSDDNNIARTFRYLHLRPLDYQAWPHSSYLDYFVQSRPWIKSDVIPKLIDERTDYISFVNDRQELMYELSCGRQVFSHLDHILSTTI